MYVSDALRSIISKRNMTQQMVADELGVSQPAVASVLSVGNPQTKVLVRLLNILGDKLVAIPKDTPLPSDAIELETHQD